MFWPNANPRRRKRHAVDEGREVLVYIDERPPHVQVARPESPPPSSAVIGATLLPEGLDRTPLRRNCTESSHTTDGSTAAAGRRGMPKDGALVNLDRRPPGQRGALEGDHGFLSLPDLHRPTKPPRLMDGDDDHHTHEGPDPRRRMGSRGSSFGSVGSTGSSAYTDDDDDDDDDNSLASLEETFDRVVMKVSPGDGVVTLEYAVEEVAASLGDADAGNFDDGGDGSSSGVEDSSSYGSAAEESSGDEAMADDAATSMPKEPRFELQSTNIHTLEDERQRERDKIRLAVLGAAVDAYTNCNVEVPDMILAQINENRSALGRGSLVDGMAGNATGSAEKVEEGKRERRSKRMRRKENRERKARVAAEERANASVGASQDPTCCRTRKLRLGQGDEIHALPCQCALSLVGMRGFSTLPSPHKEGSNRAWSSSLHGTSSGSLRKTPPRRPSVPISLRNSAPPTTSTPYQRSSVRITTPVAENRPSDTIEHGKMVRTSSAKAAEANASKGSPGGSRRQGSDGRASLPCSPSPDDGSSPLQLGGPQYPIQAHGRERSDSGASMFPKQPETSNATSMVGRQGGYVSSSFTSIGYHEITLIRKSCLPVESEEGGDFIEWDALTIRCRDHDEMDKLIMSLRTSARAHVIPFSPDPRAKLKKKNEQELAALRRRKSAKKARRRIKASTSRTSLEGSDIFRTPSTMATIEDIASPVSPPSAERSKRKGDSSKKWNKNDYCEVCGFHFTLLTRRHHCRKCDRSCCGDCSSVMLVRGGEEKRYCNRCSTDILRKQSRELHRRFSGYQSKTSTTTLPGKVHGKCYSLGVGVLGKLPHWKGYLTLDPDRRPAVGRITVELIEALAVPSVDMSGKSDPYVRATITGYDKDMRWTLREWLSSKTYSLCSSYCAGTTAPVWRGSGRKGGELLTLPVISTAGAVLRLEVMHFDLMTNARGKDVILGVVEIPLSDLPNANLRKAEREGAELKRKKNYDGYCDLWYRLQCPGDLRGSSGIFVSKPIADPQTKESPRNEEVGKEDLDLDTSEDDRKQSKVKKKVGLQSLQEISQRVQGMCRAPVEWIGTALRIDVPRRPETVCAQRRSRSAIHVRVKLNANEVGDLLSHTWFPPVEPLPPIAPYDPQVLFRNIVRVQKKVSPYHQRWKFVEDAIKWRHSPRTCIISYFVFAFHIVFIPYLMYLLHIYLYVFLWVQLRKMTCALRGDGENGMSRGISRIDSFNYSLLQVDSTESDTSDANTTQNDAPPSDSNGLVEEESKVITSPSLNELSRTTQQVDASSAVDRKKGRQISEEEDDVAKLNKAVEWIAKRLGDNRGLEILQFKLGMFGRDITNINSLWDGSSTLKTRLSMIVLIISFVLHCYVNLRLLWVAGTFIWYFGSSPFSKRAGRSTFGFFKGMAKISRRKQLHEEEIKERVAKCR